MNKHSNSDKDITFTSEEVERFGILLEKNLPYYVGHNQEVKKEIISIISDWLSLYMVKLGVVALITYALIKIF